MALNKQDLVNKIVEGTNLTKKDTLATIDELFIVMANEIAAGEEIAIPSFGKFKTVVKAARSGVNPQNPSERITIPERRCPKFAPSSVLKQMVANK